MIIIEGTARLAPGTLDQAKTAMEAMIRASREEAGCIEYAYSLDLLEPNLLRVIERWESREALVKHFATPHMAIFREALAALQPSDITIRLYDAKEEAMPQL